MHTLPQLLTNAISEKTVANNETMTVDYLLGQARLTSFI